MIELISYTFAATVFLWCFFANVTNVAKRVMAGKYNKYQTYLAWAFFYTFIIFDVLYNWVFGTLLFLQLPKWEDKTFTERLKYNLKTQTGWRVFLATWICQYLIEPWDAGHCSL